jgi:hypothetical protein
VNNAGNAAFFGNQLLHSAVESQNVPSMIRTEGGKKTDKEIRNTGKHDNKQTHPFSRAWLA